MEYTREEIIKAMENGQYEFQCGGWAIFEELAPSGYDEIYTEIYEHDDWTVYYSKVIQIEDGRYVMANFGLGATESQPNDDYCFAFFVEPYEETVIKYREVK